MPTAAVYSREKRVDVMSCACGWLEWLDINGLIRESNWRHRSVGRLVCVCPYARAHNRSSVVNPLFQYSHHILDLKI